MRRKNSSFLPGVIRMTHMLWYLDCYTNKWTATVKEVFIDEIVLDKTFFYPESGGQPSDFGVIEFDGEKFNVTGSRKEGEKVFHKLDRAGLKAGDNVSCEVDWKRRHKLMRYHTACHILSRVVFNEAGAMVTGKQIYDDKARIDFALENFDKEKIKSYEDVANSIVRKELDVKWFLMPMEEANKIDNLVRLQNKPLSESMKEVRVVDIIGYDTQACGGTHVKNTKEIGNITVIKAENKGKANRRMYFVIS